MASSLSVPLIDDWHCCTGGADSSASSNGSAEEQTDEGDEPGLDPHNQQPVDSAEPAAAASELGDADLELLASLNAAGDASASSIVLAVPQAVCVCVLCLECHEVWERPAACPRAKRSMSVPDTRPRLQVCRSKKERSTSSRKRYLARRAAGGCRRKAGPMMALLCSTAGEVAWSVSMLPRQ